MPVANSDFRIEKERLPVTVTTESGERLNGEMFVQSYARRRLGKEEAGDVLNDNDPYFPLALSDDQTVLVAKQRVRDVAVASVAGVEAAPANPAARPVTVEVVVAGGDAFLGEVRLEVPFERPRLLDFLNRLQQRFVTLHTADGIRLINSRLIERVRSLD
ncbi:MAG: hypothetical protein AVDCRST_MAG40-3371 [uncultured Gemmatimonadaceae bacterium]|uniref:Uncharacterized protein n=1 Tax=uncultured Gemmatimonadaceae bacterium TaxID=246130 RepID=A0A6J4MHB6_9BACT|nr:MAG: hypothetical protein AVDCRST_MAG40-3371 [uncultured Gemmatimonadaceae bacterium]